MRNHYKMTNAQGFFSKDNTGLIAGLAKFDPATIYKLRLGVFMPSLAKAEGISQPDPLPKNWEKLIGGSAVVEFVTAYPNAGNRGGLTTGSGTPLIKATDAKIDGFAVLNQQGHLPVRGWEDVPYAVEGENIGYVKVGSGVALDVVADASLLQDNLKPISSLSLGWDLVKNKLVSAVGTTETVYASGEGSFTGKSGDATTAVTLNLPEGINTTGAAAPFDVTGFTLEGVSALESFPEGTTLAVSAITAATPAQPAADGKAAVPAKPATATATITWGGSKGLPDSLAGKPVSMSANFTYTANTTDTIVAFPGKLLHLNPGGSAIGEDMATGDLREFYLPSEEAPGLITARVVI